jgi:hypothetical protein
VNDISEGKKVYQKLHKVAAAVGEGRAERMTKGSLHLFSCPCFSEMSEGVMRNGGGISVDLVVIGAKK